LKSRLEKRFGGRLPATLTFNYPTVAAVAEYLHGRAVALAGELAAAASPAMEPMQHADPVAEAAVEAATESSVADPDDDDDPSAERLAAMLEERLSRLDLGG